MLSLPLQRVGMFCISINGDITLRTAGTSPREKGLRSTPSLQARITLEVNDYLADPLGVVRLKVSGSTN